MGQNKGTGYRSSPKQLANLNTFDQLSPEEAFAIRSKGGKTAMAKRHEQFVFKKAAQWLMDLPAFESDNAAVEVLREKFPELTNAQAMTAAVMHRAIVDGDAKAFTAIRDTAGEAPTQKVDVNAEGPMEIKITTVD